ncbi:MAG: beta-propeller domain-containing protein, partial [Candidatus Tectomicrobia bacterium]|nr:beta-propeller domain-containing protein [Candidatus Tectomicrobia bacterium]
MRAICFLLLLLILIGGCDGPSSQPETLSEPTQLDDQVGLKRFGSATELAAFLTELNNMSRSAGGTSPPVAVTVGDVAAGAADSLAQEGGFSTTTIQEIGVDESDVVKNDGTYLYVLKNAEVRIVKAQPAETIQQVSSIKIDGSSTALYLRNNMLIALSRTTIPEGPVIPIGPDGLPIPFIPKTIVTVIDTSNRSAPQIKRTITLDGSLKDSRLIGKKLHLILNESLPRSAGAISSGQLNDILPAFVETIPGGSTQSGLIAGPTSFYRPVEISGEGISIPVGSSFAFGTTFTSVASINLDDPSAPIESLSVFVRSGILFASQKALYLASTACRGCAPFAIQTESTEVHKVALTERGPIYVASGIIPGQPLDQFSFSEQNDFLRVATTINQGPSNNLFVLSDSANRLGIVGRIENIARGERLRSARFVGDRGFLVTFRQVDPLFTLDLSDPARPRVAGELKVPGFSTFILPISDTELLTVGQDADLAGIPLGLQLSIFDVSNFANPILKHKVVTGEQGTFSEALSTPKAFTYFARRQVLALPIRETGANRSLTFVGLIVYHANGQVGFELLGRINTGIN